MTVSVESVSAIALMSAIFQLLSVAVKRTREALPPVSEHLGR
jgi:hypothetical protein